MTPAMGYSSLSGILFPIQQTLNRSLSKDRGPDRTTIKACTTLCEILDTLSIDDIDFDTFADLFVALSWSADDRVSQKEDDSFLSSREDLKAACIEACYSLVKYVPLRVLAEALQCEMFLKALGHSVSVFLSTALKEKSKSLKISATKALEILLIRSHSLSEAGKISEESLSSIYTAFIPGTSLTVLKIITSDDKHPRGLLVSLLSVLSLILTIVKPDQTTSEAAASSNRMCDNLHAVINKIIPCVIDHRSSDVRAALFCLVRNIFEKASQQLIDHLSVTLLEVALRLSMDSEDETLQNAAMTFLYDVTARESVYNITEKKAVSILYNAGNSMDSSNIKLLAAIFTLMSRSNRLNDFLCTPSHRNRLMYFLNAYTELLPVNPCDTSFDGRFHLKHISDGQIDQLTSVIAASTSTPILMDFILDFLHCTNFEPNCLYACNSIIQSSLSQSVPRSSVECNKLSCFYFETCMQLLEQSVSPGECATRPETSASASGNSLKLMSSQAAACTSPPSNDELSSKSFYKIYFALQGLQSCTVESASETMEQVESRFCSNPLDNDKRKEGEIAQFILTLLRVQSVSLRPNGTKVLFKSAQDVLLKLSRILFPSRNSQVSPNLVEKYLVNMIMLVECEICTNPYTDVSSLLFVLCSNCRWRHVPSFKCLVDRLIEVLDANHTQDANNVLKALLVMAKWMKRVKEEDDAGGDTENRKAKRSRRPRNEQVIHQNCMCVQDYASLTSPPCTSDAYPRDSCCRRCSKMDLKCSHTAVSHQMCPTRLNCDEDDLLVDWRNFIRNWYQSECFEDVRESAQSLQCEENEKQEQDGNDEKNALAGNCDEDPARKCTESMMTKDILSRCVNLLAAPDCGTRIVNLELIEITCVILDMLEEENLLLPLVHSGWRQLVIRLTDEASVARVALRVLLTLSSVCGDFIKDRTLTDVIPKIISFLKAHVNDSCRKEGKLGHRFTTVFQYQLEALNSLGKLVCNLPILGKNLWPIIAITIEYCKKDQLDELRDAACHSMSLFRRIDADALYFYCECSPPRR